MVVAQQQVRCGVADGKELAEQVQDCPVVVAQQEDSPAGVHQQVINEPVLPDFPAL